MNLERIKRRAKEIKRERGIKHMAALDLAAKEAGVTDYRQAVVLSEHSTDGEKMKSCSPLAISMLLHFYAVREPYHKGHPGMWPPAQKQVLADFIRHGLIKTTECSHDFDVTDKGHAVIEQLKAVMAEVRS